MSVPSPIPGVGAAGPALHARRCARHDAREAAARCPACGGFFCRECVVEHAGRLLCAPCLTRLQKAETAARPRGRRWARPATLAVAVLSGWLMFFLAGLLLLKVPPTLHEDRPEPETEAAP